MTLINLRTQQSAEKNLDRLDSGKLSLNDEKRVSLSALRPIKQKPDANEQKNN